MVVHGSTHGKKLSNKCTHSSTVQYNKQPATTIFSITAFYFNFLNVLSRKNERQGRGRKTEHLCRGPHLRGLVYCNQEEPLTEMQVNRMSTDQLLQDSVRVTIYHRGWANRMVDIHRSAATDQG